MGQHIVDRLRKDAIALIDEYKNELAVGGEPPFPQATFDVIWLCGEYERITATVRPACRLIEAPESLVRSISKQIFNSEPDPGQAEYDLHTQGAKHCFSSTYDGNDPNRNRAPVASHSAMAVIVDFESLLKKPEHRWLAEYGPYVKLRAFLSDVLASVTVRKV